jgi:hypothetical protein
MRRTGESLTIASRAENIDLRTVRKYVGAELRQLEGQIQPTQADRRRRDMLLPTSAGPTPIVIHGSKEASQLGTYMAAVGKYLRTGETDALQQFTGKTIAGGRPLITDPEQLSALAQAGALELDKIYALPEASS